MAITRPGERPTAASSGWHPSGSPRPRRQALGVVAAALVVAIGYYAGANIGFLLRFPPLTPSVLWPPNAILTAALLLAPVRRWWVYLAAALPAHLLAEMSWPLPLVLALFLTNSSEALIAAVCVRRWSDEPTRLDTLGRALAFVAGAGIFAPFTSSFLDAAVVTTLLGEPYWLVWRARFFSNVLTELTVAPAIVLAATLAWPWLESAPTRRKVEAALLAVGLGAVAIAVLAGTPDDAGSIRGLPPTPVTLFLPVVLWAAVRFGPGGVSASMLVTTLMLTWAATHGRGPFAEMSPSESTLSLQLHLSVSVVPFMCLAGLIEERRRAVQALAERLSFEKLVARLSGGFVRLPSDMMGDAFDAWLQRIGQFLGLDRVWLLRVADDGLGLRIAHSWDACGPSTAPHIDVVADLPWTARRLHAGERAVLERLEDAPPEASRDVASLRLYGVRSAAVLPLVAGSRFFGALAFLTTSAPRPWPAELVASAQLVGEAFASALARKESEDALRASELMKSAILASLDSGVAVLDPRGRIAAVNPSWLELAADPAAAELAPDVGASYLDGWRAAAGRGEPRAIDALPGMEAVLTGARPGFTFEYPSVMPRGERWVTISVVALSHPAGGAVVSRTDISERKRAEVEAQRSRQELAHVTRVSTIGELTTSLAHELNQPLTGILTNAQAGQRLLDCSPPRLQDLREALADIVEDDKRAAEVIQRLRNLLRKGESVIEALDIELLIRQVVKLLGSDTVIRDVTLVVDLQARSAVVSGDRVQLQQVILNLLVNAMEAMAECDRSERMLVVHTRLQGTESVLVSVEDSGPGLCAGAQDLVFEAFYTTKPTGMGMGLAIVRSIIGSHGGTISAANNSARGATFEFSLPLCRLPEDR